MFALLSLTTLSVLTLWFMTRAFGVNELGEDQEESVGREHRESKRLTPLAAWMATLSREDSPYFNTNGNEDVAPPPERHPAAASYCPRCKAEYRKGFDQCNTCDVALIMYDRSQFGL